MFETRKLRRALIDNDIDTIRALVAKHGAGILDKRLPLSFSRDGGKHPGDEWLKKVFSGPTSLGFALILERDDLVRTLVDLGASPLHRVDHNYPNMLFVAAALGRADVLVEWLDTYRGAARETNGDDDTLLHIACQHKQPNATRVLLARGFYTDSKSESGRSPLLYAEQAGDLESVKMLHAAERGQLPDRAERAGEHDLRRASRSGPVPQALPVAIAPTPAQRVDGWHVVDDSRVARVTDVPAIGYRLTEIFNFATGEVLRLNRNLETGAESAVVSSFADMAQPDVLADAAARLGKTLDPEQIALPRTGKFLLKKPD